ncbi:response regulator transcription factor [Thiorhodovibrio frisius]|uniref:Response regulator with CheY-like receiver domain and winged-helix DNA-binding domain n=1 Tax=Thiorhodovibrio frisius TaxID=631362 RepID=H8Z455_9GAMM|nr:response regulator transcription factor [Thiorhodovibrio frisius]EIC20124.1 response regulator with CheY-like receiver domain and winged-helix DNA-binding domain [Thiorhodovibrio frisius]WPL20858.1 Sensory transduction protein regX3 [Thiorhodovibrio frisius]
MNTHNKSRLLVIEDEEPIRVGLEDLFVFHGYEVESAADGPGGLAKALSGKFDLILLDIMLPGLDGFAICDQVRAVDRAQPIIMLTARTADEDIIQGLRLGADDYVAKPFSVTELVLRVGAVLRRSGADDAAARPLQLGDLRLDLGNLCGQRGAEEIPFTRREAEILGYLAAQEARPVSREELLHRVWGYARDCGIETRTVDIHIAKLRRKIETDPGHPQWLQTVRGLGYRLRLAP